jgi:glucose/arabinose dehydrogenase
MINPLKLSRVTIVLLPMTLLAHACADRTNGQGAAAVAKQDLQPKTAPRGLLGPGVPKFWVRPGYKVTLVAEGIENARFMEFDDKGTLYLSRPNKGDILALKEKNGRYELANTFIDGKRSVHGMQFANGWLWFTQTGAIFRARDKDGDGKADEIETVIPEGKLPKGGGHWWRSILVTGDSIYTSIGDSGNASDETATERQKIWKFDKNGGGKTLFASGLRNTEKLRLRPGTTEIWGADHGSDWFGQPFGDREGNQPITDFNPPDEFNRYEEGRFYGHPFITGYRVPRLEFMKRDDLVALAAKTTSPEWAFGAHWAVNSFTFLTKSRFGADHVGDVFAACHGSWNRSVPAGYRIERVLFDKLTGHPYGSLTIVGTLAEDGHTVLARPADAAEAPDGSVLFSCDFSGRIYRISPEKG